VFSLSRQPIFGHVVERRGDEYCEVDHNLNDFFRADCPELVRTNYCRVFVLPNPNRVSQIWGFYTLFRTKPAFAQSQQPQFAQRFSNLVMKLSADLEVDGITRQTRATGR
jgi:hypothetical protein